MQVDEAKQLATQEVDRRHRTSEFWQQVDDLAEVQLTEEMPEFWVFFARSEKLIQASHAPGGMHVTVDKQSGHIWTRTEIQSYYEARAASSRQKIAA